MWLISEQYPTEYSNLSTWFDHELGTSAIWISNPGGFPVEESGRGRGFIWVRSKSITYVSCYLTPNGPVRNYYGKLDEMEDFANVVGNNLIIAGDFNAKGVDWDMPYTDSRGKVTLEMASRLGLALLNVGDTTTFRRAGYTETILYVYFAIEGLSTRVKNWKVMEAYTASDRMHISFEIQPQRPPPGGPYRPKPRGWNLNKLNRERFIQALMMGQGAILYKPRRVGCKEDAEELVSEVMTLLNKACDDSMP